MRIYHLRNVMIIGLLSLTFGLVLAQEATQQPAQLPPVDMPLPGPMETELIPCMADSTGPCDMIVTKAEDIAGVWKHYFMNEAWNAPNGVAYQRFYPDGHYVIADTPEHTDQPFANYPTGQLRFEGTHVFMDGDPAAPAPFNQDSEYQLRVLKYGDQPVALRFVAISDVNFIRLLDLTQVMMRVGE
ncbi:MAG: hypothetical protein ABI970_23440 [Chloroflexota bacterium]